MYKIEGTLAIVAAIAVLVSATWDPQISMILSVVALLGFALNEFLKK